MPVDLLTNAERERLGGFLAEDLFAYLTLTGADGARAPTRSAPANRLGFALASLDESRAEGFPVNEEDLAHPSRYGHINPYGRYRFDLPPEEGGPRVG